MVHKDGFITDDDDLADEDDDDEVNVSYDEGIIL